MSQSLNSSQQVWLFETVQPLMSISWSFSENRFISCPGDLPIRVKVKAFICITQSNLYKLHSKTMISMILQLLLIHQIFGQLVKCLQIMEPVRIIRTNVNKLLSILKSASAEMMLHLKHPTILFKLVRVIIFHWWLNFVLFI